VSILDAIRRLLGGEEIPEEAERIYEMSKSEAEALTRLEAERGRSDRHREVLIGDIKALTDEDADLVSKGKDESAAVHRRILAKQVAEIRAKVSDMMNRVDILTRRIAIFDRQVALLRDRAVLEAPLPERKEIEAAAEDAFVARREFEEVAELSDVHRDVSKISGSLEGEREAMREFEGESEEDLSFDEMLREEEGRIRGPDAAEEGGREAMKE
jgi:hypothetical protein